MTTLNAPNIRRQAEITSILGALETYWRANPSLRLGQLIMNKAPSDYTGDPYYVNDSEWLQVLK